MQRLPLVRLGSAQWALVGAGLLTVAAVLWIMDPVSWNDWYVRTFVLPRLEARYGFTTATVTISAQDGAALAVAGVTRDGAVDRLGVKPGDLPVGYYGGGWATVSAALSAAERGAFAAFDVMNVDEWRSSGRPSGVRTISVNPRATDVARLLYCERWQLSSPSGTTALISVPGPGASQACDLWVRDESTATQRKVHAYRTFVQAVWSSDGAWIAFADYDNLDARRCLLLDARIGSALDLSELLTERGVGGRPRVDRIARCEVFGWVRDTSRVALTVAGYRGPDPSLVSQNLFYDVSSRSFIDAAPK